MLKKIFGNRICGITKDRIIAICVAILCMALFCCNFTFVNAMDKQSEHLPVKVGYCIGKNSGGEGKLPVSDYTYDYLMEIAKYNDWSYEFVGGTFQECLDRLKTGEIDILGPLQKTKNRELEYDFPNYEFGYEYTSIFTNEDNFELCYNDFQSFDGLTMGLLQGNANNFAFEELCEKNKITVQKKFYPDLTGLVAGLRNHEVEAIVSGNIQNPDGLKVISKFDVQKFYYVTTKGNTRIIDGLNNGLEKIKVNDSQFEYELYEKYFGNQNSVNIALTRAEHEYAINNPVINVAIDPNWEPFEYYDKKTKKNAGVTIDILSEISKRSGMKFNFIPTKSYDESIQLFTSGKADIITGNNSKIAENVGVKSNPFYDASVAIVGKNKYLPVENPTIGLPDGFPSSDLIAKSLPSNITVKTYASSEECFKALKKGDVDSLLMNINVLETLNKKNTYGQISLINMTDLKMAMGFAVRSDIDPALVSILNKSINSMNVDEINSIIISNIVQKNYGINMGEFIRKNIVLIAVLLVLIISAILFITYYHKIKLTRKFKELAYLDPLTGARNIEKFQIDAIALFSKFARDEFSMVYVDIDRFKYINDAFGHDAGNELLCYISKVIQDMLYDYEIFARLSADNFLILLKGKSTKQISDFIIRLENYLENYKPLSQFSHTVRISAGVYHLKNDHENVYTVLDKANSARKTVKGRHEKHFAFYDETMEKRFANEVKIAETMQKALDNGEFEVYMQPKYDLKTDSLAGAEALIRWRTEKGIVPPDEFIPLFEKNGFITKIDFFVFEEVCKAISYMRENGFKSHPISVNLSRVHMQSRDFIGKLKAIANKYHIPLKLLELELTETVLLQNVAELKIIMSTLKDIGFILSMDDFGTGYSSLNLLKELPMDILKIDRTFFNDEYASPREKTIMQDIVTMAHHLNMRVVSEGVENLRQRELLMDIDCDMEQGYLYSKPMPMLDFLRFAKNAERRDD